MTDQQIPEVKRIKELIPTIESRAKIRVWDYLGKGALYTPLNTITYTDGKYFGEVNSNGEAHGRGIIIFSDHDIIIEYCEKGFRTGNYITIFGDGRFRVGVAYEQESVGWLYSIYKEKR